MKQILIRLAFALIILLINLLIIDSKITIFTNYEIDLKILIPFLALLFLEPFINIFNPFFCSIKQQTSISEPNALTIKHRIEYVGKEPLSVGVKVQSSVYDIECIKGQKMFIPEHTSMILSKEKPSEFITFLLKRRENVVESSGGIKATIIYRKGYLNQKIHVK